MAPFPAVTEATPLLTKPRPTEPKKWSPLVIEALLTASLLTICLGDGMSLTPLTRLYESIVCFNYWEQNDLSKLSLPRSQVGPGAIGGVAEEYCKVAPVQKEVALLKGWQFTFDGISGLLLSIPIGALADRIGRRPILIVGVASLGARALWMAIVCWFWKTIPLRLSWLSALHGLVSGGSPVLAAIFLCAISDINSAATRVASFFRVFAIVMLMNYTGPSVSAAIMTRFTPWIPLGIALGLFLVGFLQSFLFPETLNYSHPSLGHPPLQPAIHEDPTGIVIDPDAEVAQHDPAPKSAKQFFGRIKSGISQNAKFLVSDARLPLLILPYYGLMMTEASRDLLVLFASVSYHITIAEATLLSLFGAIMRSVALLVLMPIIVALLSRYCPNLGILKRDLVLARFSIVALLIGWAATGAAANMPIFVTANVVGALGAGANSLCRSFLTEITGKHNAGKLYTIISVLESITLMVSGPMLSGLWALGLRLGGRALGMPFYAIAAIYAITLAGLCLVHVRKGDGEAVGSGEVSIVEEQEALLGPGRGSA